MLCAGIAAAGENCVDAAAWSVVAEIGSSKLIEGFPQIRRSRRDIEVAVVAGRHEQWSSGGIFSHRDIL